MLLNPNTQVQFSSDRLPSPGFVNIGAGHQLLLRDWSAGPPVLLLAGWAMDSRLWGETMVALNDAGLRAIAYDRRGHGGSTDPGLYNYDVLADDLATVIGTLDLNQLTLVTHSGAAGEAIRYITKYGSGRLSRLILVGATGPMMLLAEDNEHGFPREGHQAVLRALQTDLDAWLEENTGPFAPGASPRVLNWLRTMVMDTSRRAIVDFQRAIAEADLRREVAAIDIPVTLITGNRDVSAPPDLTARRYAALMRNTELLIYDDCAHGVMITHMAKLANDIARRAARLPGLRAASG